VKSQKETDMPDGAHGRWYEDACGTAFAMELVGERWSLLVVRELLLGGRRFSELRRALNGISAKVLTERLESLERSGALRRRMLPPPISAQVYELTEWGYAAEPAIQELGRWAAQSSLHDPTLPLSPVSLMISFRTMLDRQKAQGFDAVIGFEVAGDCVLTTLRDGQLTHRRGPTEGAQAVFRAPAAPLLAAIFYGKVPWAELAGQGVEVAGDEALALRFIDLFHLPPKLGGAAAA
jgi:DNA-binding HxlR family transcriptional regulator